MRDESARSDHIAYAPEPSLARFYEYELRWKQKAVELVRTLPDVGHPLAALDVGCGRGELLELLLKDGRVLDCVGIDMDPNCAALGSRFAPCHQASVENAGEVLRGRRFDVVICLHVLEHTESPVRAVRQLMDLSTRWLVLGVPNLAAPVTMATTQVKPCNRGHLQGWDTGHLQNLLEYKCGLRLLRWIPDQVILPKVSRLFDRLGIRRYFEYKLLPSLWPFLSQSLIVLCEKHEPKT